MPAGFEVVSAGGGREGIEVARLQHPNLILLDLMMPGVNGFDVVEALRADEATRQIPIMILTGKELSESEKQTLSKHVAGIFNRNSVAGAELIGWLQGIVTKSGAGMAPGA
jgi:CheY-like chemotaxis protein